MDEGIRYTNHKLANLKCGEAALDHWWHPDSEGSKGVVGVLHA